MTIIRIYENGDTFGDACRFYQAEGWSLRQMNYTPPRYSPVYRTAVPEYRCIFEKPDTFGETATGQLTFFGGET